jgi:CRISPR type IV-associated protein Csf2
MQLLIRGAVTTAAHTHQTSPDSPGTQLKTNVMTLTGLKRGVPYITANSVRGMIRRHAARVLFRVLIKAGATISRNLYLSIVRGSFARSGMQAGGATYTQMVAAAHNTFAGLFGGGAYMYRSLFRLESDLMPILFHNRALLPLSVQPFAIDAEPRDLTVAMPMAPRDDFARLPAEARDLVSNLPQSYNEHMATKAQQSAAKRADEAASTDNLDNYTITECIVPGVPLYFSISTDELTKAQAGLLLLAVASWANKNALGGGSARGRGSFVANLALSVDGELQTQNLLVGDAPSIKLAEHHLVAELVAACEAALPLDGTAQALGEAFPSEIPEKAPKSGKGKKVAPASAAPADA